MMPKKNESWNAIGRRKSSIARVMMSAGKGTFIINKREIKEYFGRDTLKILLAQPLDILKINGKYDISATVHVEKQSHKLIVSFVRKKHREGNRLNSTKQKPA